MPTYLLHGFRWHRQGIRIHVIVNDLEDATPEWLLAPATSISVLNSFYTLYDFLPPSSPPAIAYAHIPIPPIPDGDYESDERPKTPKIKKSRSMTSLRARSMSWTSKQPAKPALYDDGNGNGHARRKESTTPGSNSQHSVTSGSVHRQSSNPEKKPTFNDWSVVKLLEQYDPSDMTAVSQPYAYVADYMVEVSLGVALVDEMAKYEVKMKQEDGCASPTTPGSPDTPTTPDTTPTMSTGQRRRKNRRLGWLEKLRDGLQTGEDIGWHVVVCGDEERAAPSIEDIREDDGQLRTPRSAGFKGFFRKRNIHHE